LEEVETRGKNRIAKTEELIKKEKKQFAVDVREYIIDIIKDFVLTKVKQRVDQEVIPERFLRS